MTRPGVGAALAALVLATGVTGCGASDGGRPSAGTDWPSGGTPVDTSGLVYAVGDTVHLGDGSSLDLGHDVGRFVLAGAGVYFTAPDREGGDDPLYYSTGGGKARVVDADASELRASADGRYLMFMDLGSGRKDQFGTPQAEVVVVDTAAGDEVTRTTRGMGDPDSDDDLADLYEDAEPRLEGFGDGTAYYLGADDAVAIDLATGEVSGRGEDQVPPLDGSGSPDGRWTVEDVYEDYAPQDRLLSADGEQVRLTGVPPKVSLVRWIGDTVVAGYALDGAADAQGLTSGSSLPLITCEATTGRCEVVPGPTWDQVTFPEGSAD